MKWLAVCLVVGGIGVCAVLAQEGKVGPSVPESLRGDWLVPSKPGGFIGLNQRLPDSAPITIRITADSYLTRFHKEAGTVGAWDTATGKAMTVVKEPDGKEYLEPSPYSCVVSTTTVPWTIDLSIKGDDGKVIEKKGICLLKGDSLTLSIGQAGKPRPTSFDDPGNWSTEYSVMVADRVKEPPKTE